MGINWHRVVGWMLAGLVAVWVLAIGVLFVIGVVGL